jgi:amino acid transporter
MACVAQAQVEEQSLLKAMTWWDGFVVALCNPAFLIAGLGGSIGALGTTGAFVLWSISITLGALQNNIHAELASMFPNKSGGHRPLRTRGVAQVPARSSGRSRRSATGSAGPSCWP